MLTAENVVLFTTAMADMNRYLNLSTLIARCDCGCNRTIVELYRIDPADTTTGYLVARGVGDDVFMAVISAHTDFLKAMDEHDRRLDEIASLETLFNLGDAE